MKQFFETPVDRAGKERSVNLKNVTNIAFINQPDRGVHKIIFNLDSSVNLKGTDQVIPDYVYAIYQTEDEYTKACDTLTQLQNHGWLMPKVNNNVSRMINPEKITFITTDAKKNRLIVVLKTTITIKPKGKNQYNPDFMFFDFDNAVELQSELAYAKDVVSRLEM